MAKTRTAKETSMPVIVALVFFVLTTIGLGVFCYMLYSDQEAKDAAVAKAAGDLKNARTGEDEAKQIALVYRVWAGLQEGDDLEKVVLIKESDKAFQELKNVNNNFKNKGLTAAKGATLTGNEFATWPAEVDDRKQLKPPAKTTAVDLIARAYQARDLAVKTSAADHTSYETGVAQMKQKGDSYTSSQKKLDETSTDLTAQKKADQEKLKADLDKLTDQYKADIAAARDEIRKAKDQIDAMTAEERKLRADNTKLRRDLSELVAKTTKDIDPFQYDAPVGKIVNRPELDVVEIDLGSNANVQAGLTFTVLPRDFPQKGKQSRMKMMRVPDSKGTYQETPVFVPKATIEVIQVIGPDRSRARITSEDADIRDKALAGDLLYNSVWRKGDSDHIALLGLFDTNGDGNDDIATVVRDMRTAGVTVDAYFNMSLKDLKWVGGLTDRTRYVVEGLAPVINVGDPNAPAKQKMRDAMNKAKDEARNRGIQVISYRDFFGRTGYRVRLDISNDRINEAAAKYYSGLGVVEPPPTPGGN